MRIALLVLTICVFCLPGLASGSTGSFALTSDPEGTNCAIDADEAGQIKIHMFVKEAEGVTAVQFAAPKPDCWTGATWLADNIMFPVVIGDTQLNRTSGLSVAFGACLESPIYLGYMLFNMTGAAASCCEFPVIKAIHDNHPEIPGPLMVDCAITHVEALTGVAVVNVGPGCNCAQTVANRETTWGGVKEMFK